MKKSINGEIRSMKKPIDEGSRSMERFNRLINLIELFDRLKSSIN